MAATPETKIELNLVDLLVHASWPVKFTVGILLLSSIAVWVIAALKFAQLARMRSNEVRFEGQTRLAEDASQLFMAAARERDGSGARVIRELETRRTSNIERLRAAADRVIVEERKKARSLLSPLGSIASAAPFVGLFGTVYGIMDAFVRIGAAKSASLPVVAPAIGEALVTTAIGLAVAIPAVVFYNAVEKRISDFSVALEASAAEWVALLAESERPTTPEVVFPLKSGRN
ncbi:MAG: MotA/TolQ/ExbB proton channel family protein [Polyangiaceae bacterium]